MKVHVARSMEFESLRHERRHRSHNDAVLQKWRWALIAGLSGFLVSCGSSTIAAHPSTDGRPPLSIQIKLAQTDVAAGVSIHGVAVVKNGTQRAITVYACPGQWLMVGLTNGQISYDPAVATQACTPSIRLQPGRTSFPVTVSTTYGRCAMTGPFTPTLPRCGTTGPPPLPYGRYETTVVTSGLPSGVTSLPPVEVTLKR